MMCMHTNTNTSIDYFEITAERTWGNAITYNVKAYERDGENITWQTWMDDVLDAEIENWRDESPETFARIVSVQVSAFDSDGERVGATAVRHMPTARVRLYADPFEAGVAYRIDGPEGTSLHSGCAGPDRDDVDADDLAGILNQDVRAVVDALEELGIVIATDTSDRGQGDHLLTVEITEAGIPFAVRAMKALS